MQGNSNLKIYLQVRSHRSRLSSRVTFADSCILIYSGNNKISVDPTRPVPSDFAFFSHAHIDHLCRKYSQTPLTSRIKFLTSKEISLIAIVRGYSHNVKNDD